MTPAIDINCDLGEGEPEPRTGALMARVDSVNIACGAHAGDAATMRRCLTLARRWNVRVGAHPGLPDREGFGRRGAGDLGVAGLKALLAEQVGALEHWARTEGVRLHHVKLHGALYHEVESRPDLARALLDWMAVEHPGVRLYARAGGGVLSAARESASGVEVWPEGFLDRAYRKDGTLVPREQPGALLEGTRTVLSRWRDLRERGGVWSIEGCWVPLMVRTVCLHGDGAESLERLVLLRGA